jgi:hypothetical protein
MVMEKSRDVCFAIEGDEVRISGAVYLPWMVEAERTNYKDERQISGMINVLLRVHAKLSNYIRVHGQSLKSKKMHVQV